jgi:hypothetical protein
VPGPALPEPVAADDLDRAAVQLVADDGELAPNHRGVEVLAGILSVHDESGVVGHSSCSHGDVLSRGPGRVEADS